MNSNFDVCVVGAGPAGLGFAHEWTEQGRPGRLILVEAGPAMNSRFCTVQELRGCRKADPCHITAGVGGSSGLAGGKLSEYPAGRGLSSLMGEAVEAELAEALERLRRYLPVTAPSIDHEGLQRTSDRFREMDYELRHYRANKYSQSELMSGWTTMAEELVDRGVTLVTDSRVTSIKPVDAGLELTATSEGVVSQISAGAVVIATGRSGSDLIREIDAGGAPHALDVGLRIEFPADAWPTLDAVHGDLKLHFGNARTFCTSKSGWVSPYRFRDFMLLEGRTDANEKSPWSNLAITIRTEIPTDEVLGFVRESILAQGPGSTIRQPLSNYLQGISETPLSRHPSASFSYWRWGDVNALFPASIADELRTAVARFVAEVLPASAAAQAHVFGPELDYYWPTTQHRGSAPNVWSAGDVTGDYRGTLQAFAAGRYLVDEVADHVLVAAGAHG